MTAADNKGKKLKVASGDHGEGDLLVSIEMLQEVQDHLEKGIPNGTHEGKGNKRPLTEESFFSWFSEIPENDVEDIHDEIAEIIKEDLWPNPLIHFNNEGDENDDEEGKGEDGSEDDEDDEDDTN